jgi:two-component system, cell cycle sensor histidine kinase and response regulator CckA
VQLVMQRAGYRVLEADCADQAWQLWQDKDIEVDLVLTDMVMPGALSAIELARRINAAAPHVPIVFMSGYSGAFQDSGVSLVADQNFLAKPFTPDSLLRLVSRRLDAPARGAAAQS